MSARTIHLLSALAAVVGLATCPARGITLYAVVDTGELFASTNSGTSWTVLATLPARDGVGIVAGTTASRLFLATRSGVVYRSTTAGSSWSAIGAVAAADVVDMAIRPDGALLLLTRTGTIWRSEDEGKTFIALATLSSSNCVSLDVGPGGKLRALTKTGEVSESIDGGVSWTSRSMISVPDAVSLRCWSADLYVLSGTGFVFHSPNAAGPWLPIGTLSQVGMTGLTHTTEGLVAASQDGLVAKSANGSGWTWVGVINQRRVVALGNDVPSTSSIGVQQATWGGVRLKYRR